MRGVNERFLFDLTEGELSFFLRQVKQRRAELSLEIRGGYVNIYYRGGNLLKITQKRSGYSFQFDSRYCLNKGDDSNFERLKTLDPSSASAYAEHFELLIDEMQSWFSAHPKPERAYQHQLLIHNEAILDIEYQVKNQMRLDMLMAVGDRLLVVENKYGLGAITGSAGLAKHYRDISRVLLDSELKTELYDSLERIAACKAALGLLRGPVPRLDREKHEILFLLAGYNPKSRSVQNEMEGLEMTVPASLLLMPVDRYTIDVAEAVAL